MNKCTKCGAEFEGKFCPECGTRYEAPSACPQCGTAHRADERFCSNCGYSFRSTPNDAPSQAAPQANGALSQRIGFDWRKLLKYLPVAFFALWALLLWAFYAAPLIKGDGFLVESFTFYSILADSQLAQAYLASYFLVALAAISDVYILALVFACKKGKSQKVTTVFCYVFYVAVIVCTIILSTQFTKSMSGSDLEDMGGSFAAVVIAMTVLFALLQGAALFVARKFASQPSQSEPKPKAQKPAAPHKEDKLSAKPILRTLLKYAPLTLFALWAVLLWAFYAAPLIKGDGFFLESQSLYQIFEDSSMRSMYDVSYALMAFAAIACVFAAVFAYVQFKRSNHAKRIMNYLSYALYSAVLVCTIVLADELNNYLYRYTDAKGSLVGVVIAFTIIFAAAQTAAFVMNTVFGILPRTMTNVNYNGKRKRDEKIECIFGGAMCLATGALVLLFAMTMYFNGIRDYYYGSDYLLLLFLGLNPIYFSALIVAGCYVLKKRLRAGLGWTCFSTVWGVAYLLFNIFKTDYIEVAAVLLPLTIIALVAQIITLQRARRKMAAEYEEQKQDDRAAITATTQGEVDATGNEYTPSDDEATADEGEPTANLPDDE